MSYSTYKKAHRPHMILYSKDDFNGVGKRIDEGEYNTNQIKNIGMNFVPSSLKVGPHTVIEFYNGNNFTGTVQQIVNPSANNILERESFGNYDLSRQIRSIKVMSYINFKKKKKSYAIVYQNCGFGGKHKKLFRGEYTYDQLKKYNLQNDISAIKVGPRSVVELYAGKVKAFSGKVWRIINASDKDELNDRCFDNNDWSNRTYSIRIIDYDDYVHYVGRKNVSKSYVKLHQKCNFGGYEIKLVDGRYSGQSLINRGIGKYGKNSKIRDIDISALTIGPMTSIKIYDNANLVGGSMVIKNDSKIEEMYYPCLINNSKKKGSWDNSVKSIEVHNLELPDLVPIYRAYDKDNSNTCISDKDKDNTDCRNTKWEKVGCAVRKPNKDTRVMYKSYDHKTKDSCIGVDGIDKLCHKGPNKGKWNKIGNIYKKHKPSTVPLYRGYKGFGLGNFANLGTLDTTFAVGDKDKNNNVHQLSDNQWSVYGYVYPSELC